MLIKQKIRKDNITDNVSITIPIVSESKLSGDEQEIKTYITNQTNDAINPIFDSEKFIFNQIGTAALNFKFYNALTQTYDDSLENEGFELTDITDRSRSLLNSFFIAQYYDSPDLDNQTLLHSSYLNGFEFVKRGTTSTNYTNLFVRTTEFSSLFLEQGFIDSNPFQTFNIYVRYYFFNSKNGNVIPMYAGSNENSTTSEKLFYEVLVNKLTQQFLIQKPQIAQPTELKELVNTRYRNKISDTVDKLPRERQNPPIGQRFTPDGDYEQLP